MWDSEAAGKGAQRGTGRLAAGGGGRRKYTPPFCPGPWPHRYWQGRRAAPPLGTRASPLHKAPQRKRKDSLSVECAGATVGGRCVACGRQQAITWPRPKGGFGNRLQRRRWFGHGHGESDSEPRALGGPLPRPDHQPLHRYHRAQQQLRPGGALGAGRGAEARCGSKQLLWPREGLATDSNGGGHGASEPPGRGRSRALDTA